MNNPVIVKLDFQSDPWIAEGREKPEIGRKNGEESKKIEWKRDKERRGWLTGLIDSGGRLTFVSDRGEEAQQQNGKKEGKGRERSFWMATW